MSGSRGRGRGHAAAGGPPRGLFSNGVWHCDCSPRQPAVHFETKKEGPNKGKWFRTCQKQNTDKTRCKFFLWDSDAHQREAAALSSNTRTEPGNFEPTTPSRRRPSPPPPYTASTEAGSSRKRNHVVIDLDDEFGLDQTDDAFDHELQNVMTAVETPRKAAKTSEYATPATTRRKLPWQMDQSASKNGTGLQTPQTERKAPLDPFNTRLTTPSKLNEMSDGTEAAATPSTSVGTPTPSRFRNVAPDDLVVDVLDLLRDGNIRLGTEAQNELRDLLSKHAKSAEGFRRGRDVIRSTVKAKDAKITELTYRVSTLEAELEAERAMVKHLQWEAGAQDA